MTYTIEGWVPAERRFREAIYTKQQVWQWLKAESFWKRKVRQWLRAEGVSRHILMERRRGRPEAPRSINRAARRAYMRQFKRAA